MINAKPPSSAPPAGYRFPREVIAVAMRWYLRCGLSYRDVEELLAERGIEVDHVTIYRWVQTFTPEFIDAARPARHARGNRWFVDKTYVKVAGRWTYLYRAVDQHDQVIDVLLSTRRDAAATRLFFTSALRFGPSPLEVTSGPGTGLPADHRRPRADRPANHRAVCQQRHRGRPRTTQGHASTNAGTETTGLHANRLSRAPLRAKPSTWPLRDHRGPTHL